MTAASHQLRYSPTPPAHVTVDGTRYACTALLRCVDCGLVVAHYADPDRRSVAPLAAHGRSLADLAAGRLPRCTNATKEMTR